jgi:hypothetical protein
MFDKPTQERYTVIKKVSQTVTNADQADLATDFPLLQRGLRKGKIGTIFQRDFGSQHIYPTDKYPKAPDGNAITMLTPMDDLYDAKTGKRHNIHIGYSAGNVFRVNVDANDGESATPNWQDLTRVLKGVVANYGPNFITLTASTITENLSTVETVSDDECNGWVLYNKTLAEYYKTITNVVNNGSGACRVTVSNHGLVDNVLVNVEGVQGATGANGVWLVDVIDSNTFDLVGSTFGGSYTGGGVVTRLGQTLLIITDTVNLGSTVEFTVAANMKQDPEILHAPGDVVYLIRSRAWYEQLASEMTNAIGKGFGTINSIAMIDNEPQSKRTLYINSASGGQTPLRIQHHESRGRIYASSGTPLLTLPENWYLEEAIHPIFYVKFGSLENPLTTTGLAIIHNSGEPLSKDTLQAHGAWAKILATVGNVGYTIYRGSDGGKLKYIRGYIVLIFDGYQRSDPVVEFFASSGGVNAPKIDFQFEIAPAKMNQHITGMEIYAQLITDVEYESSVNNLNERNFSDADVQLVKTIYFDRVNDSKGGTVTVSAASGLTVDGGYTLSWTLSPLQGDWEVQWKNIKFSRVFGIETELHLFRFIQSTITGNPSILDNLNHAVVKTRSPVKPIFATRAGDVNGAMVVVALDDSTLACSVVGGNGVVWDDAFPDVLVSQTGSRLRIPLQSKGQMLGIEFVPVTYTGQRPSQMILVLKKHEKELVDLINGNYVYPADVASGKSIVRHPFGVVWAGEGGIYEFDGSGQERIINLLTLNEYNGTLTCDDGITSITTSAYRSAVVGGYIPLTRQVMLQVQQNKPDGSGTEYVTKLYNIDTKDWAPDRIFGDVSGGRAISFIATRNDKLVNLSISGGVIKYPVVGKFKDEILYDGTGGVGYLVEQIINVGQLYSYDPLSILKWFATDYKGQVVSGSPVFTTYFYANDETAPFDSHVQSIGGSEREIQIKNRGGVRRLRIKHELTVANALLTGELEIRTVIIGFEPDKRSGLK